MIESTHTSNCSEDIAIIVPAYKTRFLAESLASIAAQTDRGAHVYVFDDAGPSMVKSISGPAVAAGGSNWSYHRFDDNLGGKALMKHFDRCVRATKEPWVWLFSDDDLMADNCVAALSKAISGACRPCDVYCFNCVEIDREGKISQIYSSLPRWESWKHFVYFFLRGERGVPQQSIVFSRRAYEAAGGFVDFPVGWASDQATLIAMAVPDGIASVADGVVKFRNSGENISSSDSISLDARKISASLQFVCWLLEHIKARPDPNFPLPDRVLIGLCRTWLIDHLRSFHTWMARKTCFDVVECFRAQWGDSRVRSLLRLAKWNAAAARGWVRSRGFRGRSKS